MLIGEPSPSGVCGGLAGDDVRVLHRLKSPTVVERSTPIGSRLAIVVDCETTGLQAHDEIVELAMRPLTYRPSDGAVLGVHAAYVGLQEPTLPLTEDIVALTGLRDADLKGRSIDVVAVTALFAEASLVLAHSARFDRPFLERLIPSLRDKPWACTIEDADWASEGLASSKLAFVATMDFSFFFDAHRALDDVDAVVEILGRQARQRGTLLNKILRSARDGRYRLSVVAAYESKDALKARGYRWQAGERGREKCWYKDVTCVAAVDEEQTALEVICDRGAVVSVKRLTAFERFSDRI